MKKNNLFLYTLLVFAICSPAFALQIEPQNNKEQEVAPIPMISTQQNVKKTKSENKTTKAPNKKEPETPKSEKAEKPETQNTKENIKSLFFSSENYKKLFNAIKEAEIKKQNEQSISGIKKMPAQLDDDEIDDEVFLSSIFYANPETWTIWLNGEQISPKTPQNRYEIYNINSKFVEISINSQAVVKLYPNQKYNLRTGEITEGDIK
jgi:hypothetical protein